MTSSIKVLLVTKTRGYRHDCIPSTIAAFKSLPLTVTATEDTSEILSLSQYDVIALGHNTGEFLSEDEVVSLAEFVKNGGGVVGVHAAACGMPSDSRYTKVLGEVFNGHPPPEWITLQVENEGHFINRGAELPSVDAAPDSTPSCPFNVNSVSEKQFPWYDEVYTFKSHPRLPKDRTILLSVHQTTTSNDERENFPLSWIQTVGKGRVYYTALGHFDESYRNPWFSQTLFRGIVWAAKQDGN